MDICQTVSDARTLVVGLWQEVWTIECLHLRPDAASEEIGQGARLASPHQHFRHFMAVGAEQFLHRDGLRHVASSFPLYYKYHFHSFSPLDSLSAKTVTSYYISLTMV